MKIFSFILIVSVSCLLLLSCKKDNPTESNTTGTLHGSVFFDSPDSSWIPSATKLLAVAIYPFSNTNMQGPPNGSTIQMSSSPVNPFYFALTVPTGDYHLIAMFDANGDGSFNSGNTDPYLIWRDGGTFGATTARFTVIAGEQNYEAHIMFDNSFKK